MTNGSGPRALVLLSLSALVISSCGGGGPSVASRAPRRGSSTPPTTTAPAPSIPEPSSSTAPASPSATSPSAGTATDPAESGAGAGDGGQVATTASTTTPTTTPTTAAPKAPTTTAGCGADVAEQLASTGDAGQVVTVESSSYDTTYATLTAWRRQGGCWVVAYGPWSARIGANGFSDHKQEGDDTTPTGSYGIGSTMYGNAANPGVSYPYHRLVCGDWWDEDPSSPEYNTFQHVACGQKPPFGGGSEALWEETTAYPSFAVVDYNTAPVVKGAGSAIFIHADVGGPTAGCVSLPLGELDELLDWLSPSAAPLVVMGPSSEISRY